MELQFCLGAIVGLSLSVSVVAFGCFCLVAFLPSQCWQEMF